MRFAFYLFKEGILDQLKIRRKPRTLQMPITSRCNSRCVTCNVWKEHGKVDIDAQKLRQVLASPFFSEVRGVGLNGGELTLVPNFFEILDAVLTLPKLSSVHLISNGLLPDKLLPLLEEAKAKCALKHVTLGFTLSVDGVGKIHEQVRGVPHCFDRTRKILDAFKENPGRYYTYGRIGCTLSRFNIYYVREMEEFFSYYPLEVEWHIAVPNKRIHTFGKASNYYLVDDEEARHLAIEFFYGKMCTARRFNKFRWFAQYYFLLKSGHGRLAQCGYRYKDVTIDENLYLYLCATASDKIGDLNYETVSQIKRGNRFSHESRSVGKYCDICIHYIYDNPTVKGFLIFMGYILRERFKWGRKFKLLVRW